MDVEGTGTGGRDQEASRGGNNFTGMSERETKRKKVERPEGEGGDGNEREKG